MWTSCAASVEPQQPGHTAGGLRVSEGMVAGFHFLEVVPRDAATDARLPMIVWLHGRGDLPRSPEEPFLGLEEPMRLILFRAPEPFRAGYSWLPVSASPGESPELVHALEQRSDELARAIRLLRQERPTRGKPIVMGFSQGGMLTMALAVHHPEVVGAAFPLAGWLPPSLAPLGPPNALQPPIRLMHGVGDDILPIGRTRESVRDLERRGFDVELLEFEHAEHLMTGDMWRQLRKWLRFELRKRELEQRTGRRSMA